MLHRGQCSFFRHCILVLSSQIPEKSFASLKWLKKEQKVNIKVANRTKTVHKEIINCIYTVTK